MSSETDNYTKEVLRYIIGLGLAALLTIVAYGLVTEGWFDLSNGMIALVILGLAAVQVLVQVIFFLHINDEKGPKWKTMTFSFTAMMMMVVVIGSIWIMANLDYRMGMSSEQMNDYMIEQNGKGF